MHRARERRTVDTHARAVTAVVVAVPAPVKMRTPLADDRVPVPRHTRSRRDHVSARSRYAIRAGTLVEWKNVPIDAARVRDSTPLHPSKTIGTGADSSSLALARFPVTPERVFFVCTRTI